MARARRAKKPVLGEEVATARMRYYGVGQRKVRYVADLIRGLTVAKAQEQLTSMHKPSAAPIVSRLLKSAVSNANQASEKSKHKEENLIVGTIFVDGGPIQYRHHPMPMGRAGRIRKRTCHITVRLHDQP